MIFWAITSCHNINVYIIMNQPVVILDELGILIYLYFYGKQKNNLYGHVQ